MHSRMSERRMLRKIRNGIFIKTNPPHSYRGSRKMMVVLDRNSMEHHQIWNNQGNIGDKQQCQFCEYSSTRTSDGQKRLKRQCQFCSFNCTTEVDFTNDENFQKGNHVFIGAATTRPAVDCIYDVTPVGLAKNVQAEPEDVLASRFLDIDPRDLTDIKVQTPDEETAPLVSVEYDVDVQAELKPQGVLASRFLDPKDLATDIKVEAVGETAGLVTYIAENGVTPLEENPEELYDNSMNVKCVPTSVTRKNEQFLPGDGSSRKVIACTKEGGEKPYKCQLCNYRATRKDYLKRHERAVHQGLRPYKCQFCDYRATQKAHLMRHNLNHTGEGPYQCKLCDYTAIQKETLKMHEMRHRGEEPEKKSRVEKPYKCQYCDYRAARKGNIKTHERIHTGEKPYKCSFCDHRTISRGNIRTHEMIHSGEKPYKCQLCNYTTNHQGYIKSHEMIHSGEKPYKCQFCIFTTAEGSSINYVTQFEKM